MSSKIHFVIHVVGYQAQQQMLTAILYFWRKQIEKENMIFFFFCTARYVLTHEICITTRNEQVESFVFHLLCM